MAAPRGLVQLAQYHAAGSPAHQLQARGGERGRECGEECGGWGNHAVGSLALGGNTVSFSEGQSLGLKGLVSAAADVENVQKTLLWWNAGGILVES